MKNIPPTKKEKMLIKVMVRIYSKEELEKDFEDIENLMDSALVNTASRMIGIDVPLKIDGQYLKYSIDNYEEIKNNNYPDQFERMSTISAQIVVRENISRQTDYELILPYLKSRFEDTKDEIESNLWNYDPQEGYADYGDSDIYDTDFEFEDDGPYPGNIIE